LISTFNLKAQHNVTVTKFTLTHTELKKLFKHAISSVTQDRPGILAESYFTNHLDWAKMAKTSNIREHCD